jgi:hypothetical protein
MTKLINISRLAKPTAVLVASAALISSAATAKGDHHQCSNVQSTGPRPHFVISSQPANVKRVTHYQKERDGGKKKGCGKIIVPTAEYGVSSKNRSGLAAGSEPFRLFLLAQFRCLPEIFRMLDKRVSISHARDVIGNRTYAL